MAVSRGNEPQIYADHTSSALHKVAEPAKQAESVKPGALAPGNIGPDFKPAIAGESRTMSAVARFTG